MCTYISAIVPKSADVARLSEIAARHSKDLRPFANSSIQSQLNSGESLFLTTAGHCDCGSAIGSSRLTRRNVLDLDEERSKLAKKGWSKSKIERALAQRLDKVNAREQDQNSELGKDLENWLGFLREALSQKDVAYIGLLTHHYSGSLVTEELNIADRQVVAAADISQAMLGGIAEDVVYQPTAHA
nr:putative integron gene cassette protein [uncultured bacterium]